MNYPLQLSFDFLSIARKLSGTDSNWEFDSLCEAEGLQTKRICRHFRGCRPDHSSLHNEADRVLDFSASYHFADNRRVPIGTVRRKGMRSLWKTRYDILNGSGPAMTIQEANPWTKVLDGLFCEIPLVGMFSGYLFHPEYVVAREDGTALMRLKKEPAFFQGKFSVEKLALLNEQEETRILLSLIMMVLLERQRG